MVDGANVAWNYGKELFPHFDGILHASSSLIEDGYTVIIVLSARYHDLWSDEIVKLSSLDGVFVIPPISDSKSDDRIMIDYASNKNCKILSNDRFRDHVRSLPKSKREEAENWVASEVLQFHFGVDGFTFGVEESTTKKTLVRFEQLAQWMSNQIRTDHPYGLTEIGTLLVDFYSIHHSSIPTKIEFCQALGIGSNVRINRIVKFLLSPKYVGFGRYDGKIDFHLQFQKRDELSLNTGVFHECIRQLKGILHHSWVDGLTLSHQLNVGLGNSLGLRVNSDTIRRHLGLPKETTFRDILNICLGDDFVEIERKKNGQLYQWYTLKNQKLNHLPDGTNLKSLIKEVDRGNYSVLNLPISILVPEYNEIIEIEELWQVGMGKSKMAGLVIARIGKSVKDLFGSINNMVSVVNHWNHRREYWGFDSNGQLFRKDDLES